MLGQTIPMRSLINYNRQGRMMLFLLEFISQFNEQIYTAIESNHPRLEVYYNFYRDFLNMQQYMLALSNIYNFANCETKPPVRSSISLLSEFMHIYSLLCGFVENDEDPKFVFQQLNLFLTKQEEIFGPRQFRKLVEGVSTVVLQYVLTKLRNNEIDRGVLCLTYFERSCQRYLALVIRLLINMTYCLAQFCKNTLNTMEAYINSGNQLLKVYQKTLKNQDNFDGLALLLGAFTGINHFYNNRLTKAKSIFSDMISCVTIRIHQQKMKTNTIQPMTVNFFVLGTYYMALTYHAMGNHDISAYNLTQCCHFATDYLPQCEEFVGKCQEGRCLESKKVVKLSRIENKIERIKSLHSINSLSNQLKPSLNKENSTHIHQKISKSSHKPIKIGDNNLNKELANLFTLDEKDDFRLKKRTLKFIKKQTTDKLKRISIFKQEIDNFHEQKKQIQQRYRLDCQMEKINQIQIKKRQLRSQIMSSIWPVLGQLPQAKKLKSYLLTFNTIIHYETSNKFYRFLYNNVGLIGHLVIFKWLRKIRSKLERICIRSVMIQGVRHQLEFLTHKTNGTKHIKIYNVVKGFSVNDSLAVDEQLFDMMQEDSVESHFEIVDGRLVHLKKYLSMLNEKVITQVKLFIIKLRKRILRNHQILSFNKKQVYITFNQYRTQLVYIVFVVSKRLSDGLYCHTIQRIDKKKYKNPDYNIRVMETITNHSPQLYYGDLDEILTKCILKQKEKYSSLIIRIQTIFRKILSEKAIVKKREKMNVITTQINKNLFTLLINGQLKTFFIENLQKKYPIVILEHVEYNNLAFVNKLRDQLCKIQDCSGQLAIIKKHFKLREFGARLIKKSKYLKLDTNFSSKFKKSLCFSKMMKQILYKGKYVDTKALYMLIVKDFQAFPRPYLLRVFNLQSESLFSFDIEKTIYGPQKLFLQANLDRINQYIDIHGQKQANIIAEGVLRLVPKSKRMNSKSTILSSYSFNSGEQFPKEPPRPRMISRMQSRQSCAYNRNKRNSINFKMRHKSALKQKDILLIKKWIEDSKQNQLISQFSQSSNG